MLRKLNAFADFAGSTVLLIVISAMISLPGIVWRTGLDAITSDFAVGGALALGPCVLAGIYGAITEGKR